MSNFGSFSYFQTSLSLGVGQVLQKLSNDLKLLFHCYILIPGKCPRKTPFKTQCPMVGIGLIFKYMVGSWGPFIHNCNVLICSGGPALSFSMYRKHIALWREKITRLDLISWPVKLSKTRAKTKIKYCRGSTAWDNIEISTETFRHLRKDRPNDFTAPKNTSTVHAFSFNA